MATTTRGHGTWAAPFCRPPPGAGKCLRRDTRLRGSTSAIAKRGPPIRLTYGNRSPKDGGGLKRPDRRCHRRLCGVELQRPSLYLVLGRTVSCIRLPARVAPRRPLSFRPWLTAFWMRLVRRHRSSSRHEAGSRCKSTQQRHAGDGYPPPAAPYPPRLA